MGNKFSCLILFPDNTLGGVESYDAEGIVDAAQKAVVFSRDGRGLVLRVESCDFGPAEMYR